MKNKCPYQRDSKYCTKKHNTGVCIYKNQNKCPILQRMIKNAPQWASDALEAALKPISTTKSGYMPNKERF